MVHPQTEIGVAHFLGGNIIIPVGDLLVGLVDTYTDFIQHTVGLLCSDAAAGDTVPRLLLHVQLATELGYFAVYRDTAHDGNKPVLFRGIAFQIKQNFECRSHNSTIFNETKLLLVELFDEMQTAANQCNRGGKQTFFTAASPKSENPTVFTVEDSRIVPVIQRFEILPKPPLPFGTE